MIQYSAIVLDKYSKETISSWCYRNNHLFGHIDINKWNYYGDHSTICQGELPQKLKSKIDDVVLLEVVAVGISDRAIALKVKGNDYSVNKIPHITVFVNKEQKGKPYDSNHINVWRDLKETIVVSGTIKEVE